MSNQLLRCLAIATLVLSLGCSEKTEDNEPVMLDAGTGMSPDAGNPFEDYCNRTSTAKCDYVFGCVTNGYLISSYFGLPGSTAETCATQLAAQCLADLNDRSMRDTVNFTEAAIDTCVQQVESKPCPPTEPSEWANQWHNFIANFCDGVARGNVQTGDACVKTSDCTERHASCISGICKIASSQDLLAACQPGNALGSLVDTDTCATGQCANAGYGGTCTVDCRTGRGCVGDDVACLQLAVAGGSVSSFCVVPCESDDDCGDLACRQVDPSDEMSDTYCLGRAE